jgi:hypothetical protein
MFKIAGIRMNSEISFRLTQKDLSLQQERRQKRYRDFVGSDRSAFSRALRTTILPLSCIILPILFLTGNSRQDKWLVVSIIAVPVALAIAISTLDARRYLRLAAEQGVTTTIRLKDSQIEIVNGEISTTAALAAIANVAESMGHMIITWKGGFELMIPLHAFASADVTSAWFEALTPVIEVPAG